MLRTEACGGLSLREPRRSVDPTGPPQQGRAPPMAPTQWPLLAVTLLSISGYAMTIPLLPQLVDADLLGPTYYGVVQSVANLVSLFAAPALGHVSDTRGRRVAAMCCASLGTMGTLLLGTKVFAGEQAWSHWATSGAALGSSLIWLPTLGMILRRVDRNSSSGVLQALCADGTLSDGERLPRMARFNTAFSLGFTCGSSAGGALSRFGNGAVVSCAAAAATLTLILEALLLPNTAGIAKPVAVHPDKAGKIKIGPDTPVGFVATLRQLLSLPNRRTVGALLLCRGLMGLAFFILTGTFDLYCRERFAMDPET